MIAWSIAAVAVALPQGGWHAWWEHHRVELLSAVDTGAPRPRPRDFFAGKGLPDDVAVAPSAAQVRDVVRPAVVRVLREGVAGEVRAACLVALAGLQRVDDTFDLAGLAHRHFADGERAVRTSAVLAFGVAGDAETPFPLVALVADSPAGRKLVERERVDEWTRVFAAYGLGAFAGRRSDHEVKRIAFACLRDELRGDSPSSIAVRAAAAHSLAMLAPDPTTARGRMLADECARELMRHAHQPYAQVSVGPMLAGRAPDDAVSAWVESRLRGLVESDGAPGAILALGALGARDEDSSQALWSAYRDGEPVALIALGQIGGDANRDRIVQALRRGSQASDRPWAALALGLLARGAPDGEEPIVAERLRGSLVESRHADAVAASAVAVGIANVRASVPELRAVLDGAAQRPFEAGHAALALGVLGDFESAERLRDLLDGQTTARELQRGVALALGALRDRASGPSLVDLLAETGDRAFGDALVLLGDHAVLGRLLAVLEDRARPAAARAVVAATLGGLCASELRCWSAPFVPQRDELPVAVRAALEAR